MVVSGGPPLIVVSKPADLTPAARLAALIDRDRLTSRPDSHIATADSLAWLTGAPEGRAFLRSSRHRALARGAPADHCPAAAAVGGAVSVAAATEAALASCLEALPSETKGDCGCRLIAFDDVLAVPRSEMGYATGVSARLTVKNLGIDAMLVAEDEGEGAILLRDLRGPVARILPLADGRAALTFVDTGARFEGQRKPVGYRRGRLAEQLYLSDAAGTRAVLLVGFSPAELAAHAGAGLAWPKDG